MGHETKQVTVPKKSLSPQRASCPFCDSRSLSTTAIVVQRNPLVEYLRCRKCQSAFTSRAPTGDYLLQFYNPINYEGTISANLKLAQRLARWILREPVRDELLSLGRPLKILDFGGGSGILGLELKRLLGREDTRVVLVDLYPPVDSSGLEFIDSHSIFSRHESDFDLVVASAVIEHLAEPGVVLRDLYKRLLPGGFLYFRAPSLLPLGRLRKGLLRWPEHLADLSPSFWASLPGALGWEASIVRSEPSQTSDLLRENFIVALLANIMKIPGRLEGRLATMTNHSYTPRYQCAGGWDVSFRRNV